MFFFEIRFKSYVFEDNSKSYKLSIVIFVCIAQIYYYNQVYCERMTHEKGFNGALQNIITEQKQNMQAF